MKKKPVPKEDDSDASDAVDEPEEVSEDESAAAKRRKSGRLRPGAKKAKVADPSSSEGEEEPEDDEEAEDEEEEEGDEDEESADSEEEYKTDQSGAYVVLKTDLANGGDPPIWKIDGKALLQKYIPFDQDGKTLYKNTSTYSGWSTGNKDNYYSAPIVYKVQNRKETIVEFLRDSIKIESATAPAAPAETKEKVATEQ